MTFAFGQLSVPACESATVALLHTPGPSVTVPKSRSCSLAMMRGLTFDAVTDAVTVAAPAGTQPQANERSAANSCATMANGRRTLGSSPEASLRSSIKTEMVEFQSTLLPKGAAAVDRNEKRGPPWGSPLPTSRRCRKLLNSLVIGSHRERARINAVGRGIGQPADCPSERNVEGSSGAQLHHLTR